MAAAGVDNTQGISGFFGIPVNLLYCRLSGIFKIYMDDAAHSTGQLIHQPAGLTEKGVLGKLSDFGNFHVINRSPVIEVVQNIADHHGKGR